MSEADHAKVSAAIAAAEGGTDGEVIAITTERSDSYHDVGLHYAVAVLFLVLALFRGDGRAMLEVRLDAC